MVDPAALFMGILFHQLLRTCAMGEAEPKSPGMWVLRGQDGDPSRFGSWCQIPDLKKVGRRGRQRPLEAAQQRWRDL